MLITQEDLDDAAAELIEKHGNPLCIAPWYWAYRITVGAYAKAVGRAVIQELLAKNPDLTLCP